MPVVSVDWNPKRIADGENFLADLQSGGIGREEARRVFPFGIDLNQGDIVALVGADKFRYVLGLVTEHDLDGLRFLYDVKLVRM